VVETDVVDQIIRLFRARGDVAYLGEEVSQTEHALQAAMAAEQSGASSALIVASLLHDIGHLLHHLPDDCAAHGIDDHHEALGGKWLARHCGCEVTEPIRLHVAAKRYLCATESSYFGQLSETSVRSLGLQGGPYTAAEVAEFERHPHYAAAVALRRFDEAAKIKDLPTPDLEHYRPHLLAVWGGPGPSAERERR
jgi:[1-hydroxy-2-(trimethylamino)ethyl]phosphonate dioxygenase